MFTRCPKLSSVAAVIVFCLMSNARAAPAKETGRYEWVTLGTAGGPVAQPGRNEPANLVVRGGEAHLVDAGDGAMTAVVEAGTDYRALRSVWISHIHFDHLGGLYAVLGLRLQTRAVGPLSIYGPPGMREIVNGLLAAMRPSARSGFGVPGEVAIDPAAGITVVELKDGDIIERDGLKVTIAANSHYSFAEGSAEEKYFRSYSFRFDLADRSIVYTGDTGPSDKVINLARGADLLVTEMVDLDGIKATMTRYAKHMSAKEIDVATQHLTSHHLTTADISAMAARAGVKAVVVTHIAGGNSKDAYASDRYAAEIGKTFRGPVHIAKDLERF